MTKPLVPALKAHGTQIVKQISKALGHMLTLMFCVNPQHCS